MWLYKQINRGLECHDMSCSKDGLGIVILEQDPESPFNMNLKAN